MLFLSIKGRINFLQLAGYGQFGEQRYRQQFEKSFDFMEFNKELAISYGSGHYVIGYFSECMSGFEHQVASHMMAEGMVEESLVLTKSIHDRYHAFKRNPFNEIECSDHYGRAMASYGTFISACGFTYHGPKRVYRLFT